MKKSSTVKFIMKISFLPSICIHRSMILIFIGKKVCLSIFPPQKIFCSAIFDFPVRKNPRFCEEFQALYIPHGTPQLFLLNLPGLTFHRSLSFVVCAVSKKPQSDYLLSQFLFQPQQRQCNFYFYLDSLSLNHSALWSVLC